MISLDYKLSAPESGCSQGQQSPWVAGARQEFKATAESELPQPKAPQSWKRPIEEELRMSYLEGLGTSLLAASTTLRPVVQRALSLGFARRTLLTWGVEAGYSKGYVSSILSRILVRSGVRQRKPGPGRRTPREALELLTFASERYGPKAAKYLLAAYRAALRVASNLDAGPITASGSDAPLCPKHAPAIV